MENNPDRLVIKGVRELAKVLGIGVNHALELTRRDDFPSARLGKIIVVPVDGLKEWLARGGTEPKSA